MPGWRKTPEDRRRDNATYSTSAWRKARRAQLERDRYVCQLRYPDICTYRATSVDHIDGAAADPQHKRLRSACEPCHRHRTATEQGGGSRKRGAADPEPIQRTLWP